MNMHRPHVQAVINYVRPGVPLVSDQRHLGPGSQEIVDAIDPQLVPIFDARLAARDANLRDWGFELVEPSLGEFDASDEAAVARDLYPRVIDYLKRHTGASYGLIFDHTVRSPVGKADSALRRAPVKTVHNDYTDRSAAERIGIELERRGVSRSADQQYLFVNLWMPLIGPVLDSPLAVADGRSFQAEDFHKLKLLLPDREGEIGALSYRPEHRWYYAPRMTTEEALLLKVYDSDPSAPVRWAPHSAFVDPTTPADAPPRKSIELRSILLLP